MNKVLKFAERTALEYHKIRSQSDVIGIKVENPDKIESIIEFILTPAAYLLTGKTIVKIQVNSHEKQDNPIFSYQLKQTYEYRDRFFALKVVAAILALPLSLIIGWPAKRLLQLMPSIKKRNQELTKRVQEVRIDRDLYQKLNIYPDNFKQFQHQNAARPGYEDLDPKIREFQSIFIEGLRDIHKAFEQYGIAHFIDCGTAMGAYRYGNIIPWDWDVDLSILEIDYQNAMNVLKTSLDRKKYEVLDWSSFDYPQTYIRVYIKAINAYVDVYHYKIDEQKQEAYYFYSYRESVFVPENLKKREFACEKRVKFSTLFPLQQVKFAELNVPCANDIEAFLQSKYGKDLRPTRVWNFETHQYDKVVDHSYWKQNDY